MSLFFCFSSQKVEVFFHTPTFIIEPNKKKSGNKSIIDLLPDFLRYLSANEIEVFQLCRNAAAEVAFG